MSEINFEFSVGSDVDYNNLIADIGFGNNLVALLTQEEGFEKLSCTEKKTDTSMQVPSDHQQSLSGKFHEE